MNYIYVISTFTKCRIDTNDNLDFGEVRPICWQESYEAALRLVVTNCCNIYEEFYTYAVIEKLASSMYPVADGSYERHFFKWDSDSSSYKSTDEIEKIINNTHILPAFSIG